MNSVVLETLFMDVLGFSILKVRGFYRYLHEYQQPNKMKNSNYSVLNLISLIAIGLLTFASCGKTQEEIIEDITPSVTAKVSGQDWTTNIAAGVNSTIYVITASKDREAIILTIPTKTVGVYPIDGLANMASYVADIDSLSNTYIAYSGSIEIKDMNFARTQFNGTFEFTAVSAGLLDTIQVTGGIMNNIPTK